jgi:hypothetical protein
MNPEDQLKVLRIIDSVQRKYDMVEEGGGAGGAGGSGVAAVGAVAEANMTNRQVLMLAHIRWKTSLLQKHVLRCNLRLVYGVALGYENMGLGMNDLILEGFKGLQKVRTVVRVVNRPIPSHTINTYNIQSHTSYLYTRILIITH